MKSTSVIIDNILNRSSIRSYQDKEVESEKIETLLRAAMAAPSAADKRPWHFVVVTDKRQLEGLASANPYAGFAKRAPLAIVACGDMEKALPGNEQLFWIQDVSAAIENILLAASALGLGAVWTAVYPIPERCEVVSKVLILPKNIIPLATIVIGYPKSTERHIKDKWDESNVSWQRYGEKKA